jgi:hypothetical protein
MGDPMRPNLVKKTMVLNQDYINRARRFFHAKTEKEAVNRALEFAAEEERIISVHEEIGGSDIIERVYK